MGKCVTGTMTTNSYMHGCIKGSWCIYIHTCIWEAGGIPVVLSESLEIKTALIHSLAVDQMIHWADLC